MKKILIPVFGLMIVIILAIFGFSWWQSSSQAVSSDSQQVVFLILKGRAAAQIGEKLQQEGLIKNALAFKIYVQTTGQAKKIQSGEYRLSPSLTLVEVVNRLAKGPSELWVTIPEGLRREEIVEKVISDLQMKPTQANTFRQEFLGLTEGNEGYLFPDTYLFPKDVEAPVVVNKLKATFVQRTASLEKDIDDSRLTLNQIVTLASIIERETITDSERPIVAGLLLKRLDEDWPLQADASVQYAVASNNCQGQVKCEWWPILTFDDLQTNSSFNTYKFNDLPPAPIASPGLSSIKAAVNPQESAYWFYIHDSEGNIHFAETIGEHNSNIRKYLGK